MLYILKQVLEVMHLFTVRAVLFLHVIRTAYIKNISKLIFAKKLPFTNVNLPFQNAIQIELWSRAKKQPIHERSPFRNN